MSTKKLVIFTIILLLLFAVSSFGYTVLDRFHNAQYGPGDLAYDEATDILWASDIVEKKIRKIDPLTGSVLTSLDVGYNELPLGLTYRDSYLWNSDQWAAPDGLIHKVDPADGSSIRSITGLGGLTFDHRGWLWCTNWVSELSALDPADGSILDTITLPGFDPYYDQNLGLAFDESTQTLWVSVVTNAWDMPGGGAQTNFLFNVALDGTVLSTEVFDPDPALDGYQLVGLAFDNNNTILWANYSLFDRPPTSDDTYIYKLSPEVTPSVSVRDIVLKDLDGHTITDNFSPGANIRYKIKFLVYGQVGKLYKVAVSGKTVSLYKPDGINREWKDKFDNPTVKTKKPSVGEVEKAIWDRQIPGDATPGYQAKVKFKLKLKEYDDIAKTWNLMGIYYANKKFNIVP